jgi:hypothetical protein
MMEGNRFIVLFRGGRPFKNKQEEDDMMNQWYVWMGQLAQKKQLGESDSARYDGKRISGEDKKVEDITLSPEAFAGYLIVRANNLDEAVEIAKDCPHLRMGGSLEIHELLTLNRKDRSGEQNPSQTSQQGQQSQQQ